MISLIGILIVVLGLAKGYNTLAVVASAGVVTGLVAGMGIVDILETLGNAFVTNRYMSLFILTLPAIGLAEKHGLREQAAHLIGKIRGASAGRIIILYQVIRTVVAAFGLRLGGHPTFVRPLIAPMAEGAADKDAGQLDTRKQELVRAHSAASENYGNFFGQNIFVAAGGLLLIKGVLTELGYEVDLLTMAKYSIPAGIIAVVLGALQMTLLDKRLRASTSQNQDTVSRGGAR